VGNSFGGAKDSRRLYLSNGGTDVFFDVMTLAACPPAGTPWQQNLALHFADGHRHSRGFSGYDLDELPWTAEATAERAFLQTVVAAALSRRGWGQLAYDPPHIAGMLSSYAELIAGFTPVPNPSSPYGDWQLSPAAAELEPCVKHGIFVGEFGCRLCDTWIQPV